MRTNEYGQSIGDAVPGWVPRPAPAPLTLAGRVVRLEPAGVHHAGDLFDALGGESRRPLWTYRTEQPPNSRDELAERLAAPAAETVCFVVVPQTTGRASGMASLMRAAPDHGCVEVGAIIYGPALQRTVAATEAMYLLARHVFENLGYRRYEWKCDAANEPSQRAASRLGFSYEGRFRKAVVYKGRSRDTDWFSMLDAEWPRLRTAYDAWLDPANFDDQGGQRARLGDLIAAAADSRGS